MRKKRKPLEPAFVETAQDAHHRAMRHGFVSLDDKELVGAVLGNRLELRCKVFQPDLRFADSNLTLRRYRYGKRLFFALRLLSFGLRLL